ncbi:MULTISPECIES: MYG1 family protein [unclassified Duganella]|uniref:MYG1 family protein n=1 Tax=unclassified Duganella TaxID=2636909 RepID=UPI0006F78864|nr:MULTISPECIES: MYG1 family protein [unclassified Duganella]KQV44929.1 metal-dependent hydrolase [Duganella sp. Root336D2]KRB92948.1 metal-dependent hydrolase [Duganella sp. Root198D2]
MLIVTHSGKFHADDAWAVAVLNVLYPGAEIIRTRDQAIIDTADFAVDVGGVWDPATGRFDHHQKGFDVARQSGVPYASAGLVWREYGARCVAALALAHTGQQLAEGPAREIAYGIDADVVQYLDLSDVGAAKSAPGGYGLSAVVSGYNTNWLDEQRLGYGEETEGFRLSQFRRAMALLTDVMANAVRYRVAALLALEQVRQGEVLEGGKVLFLKNGALPWSQVVRKEMPKVLFVISYSIAEQRHMLHTVPVSTESFDARADLPQAWAGLRDAELAAVTGVPDAGFCHNGRFIASARSYEGIRAMASLALKAVAPA